MIMILGVGKGYGRGSKFYVHGAGINKEKKYFHLQNHFARKAETGILAYTVLLRGSRFEQVRFSPISQIQAMLFLRIYIFTLKFEPISDFCPESGTV